MIKKVLILVLTMGLALGAYGQSLEETLSNLLKDNATMYMQPMGDGMGALMNSGYYHRSKVHKMLGFDLSIKLMALQVNDDAKWFDFALGNDMLQYDLSSISTLYDLGTVEISMDDVFMGANTRVPTIAGDADSIGVIEVNTEHLQGIFEDHILAQLTPTLGPAGAALALSNMSGPLATYIAAIPDIEIPGLGLAYMALPMPQLAVGLPMGIEVTVRGFPEYDIPDVGKFTMYGGGLRLNIDQFIPIPLFPVDITAGAFYSQMSIGDIFTSSNASVGLQVGKSINLLIFGLGVYADAAYETSSISIGYDVDPNAGFGTDRLEFDMTTDPGLRLGVGFHLKPIPLVNLSAHVAQTPNNVVATAGLSISLR